MKKLRVGVLFGGRSGEHEVSLASAASVMRALDPNRYEVVPIGITKEGRWVLAEKALQLLGETPIHLRQALSDGRHVVLPAEPSTSALLPLSSASPGEGAPLDVIFPVLHGTFGEDGTVQGLLELADIPYVGAGVLASAVGMDKEVQKRLFRDAGLPLTDFLAIRRSDWEARPQEVLRALRRKFRFPVFTKPATLGSSVGMTKVRKAEGLKPALDSAAEYGTKLLVERAITGREIECSVLGNARPIASVPGEIVPHREFYDYTAKYLEEGTELIVPAKLSRAQVKKFQEYAVRAYEAIDCEGMARVDFFLERKTGRIYVNEINTIPGFTAISMYPKLWEASGISYGELIDRLIALALDRHREKARTKYSIALPAEPGGILKE